MILTNNILPEECRQVWDQAKAHADEVYQTNIAHSVRAEAVPEQDPEWNYSTQRDIIAMNKYITCLLTGLHKATLKEINYDRIQEGIQNKHENPPQLLDCLTKALLQYTNLDPQASEHKQLFMTYFFFQSCPNTRAKLKCLERRPLTA